jgi:hypothetical protein
VFFIIQVGKSLGAIMTQAERMANEAVYTLQLNTRDAVRYIQRNAKCAEDAAAAALKSALSFWRK